MTKPMLSDLNEVLSAAVPRGKLKFVLSSSGVVYLKNGTVEVATYLNSTRQRFAHDMGKLSIGGTEADAISQLVCWYRDLPRLPLKAWKYWSSENVQAVSPAALPLLERYGYFDLLKTACVLCGETNTDRGGLDWWSMGTVAGPCCKFGECREGRSAWTAEYWKKHDAHRGKRGGHDK